MQERFTRERQRAAKLNAFSLDDDTELTHYGQSLSNMDDFDTTGLALDDEDDAMDMDRDTVARAHFGGFGEDGGQDDDLDSNGEPRKKSKAEVMAEVIAKSKEHKVCCAFYPPAATDLLYPFTALASTKSGAARGPAPTT